MLITILSWIAFGLIVGFVARALVPGTQSMSAPATVLIGVAGSFVGGLAGNLLAGFPALHVHAAGFIGSILGAIMIVVLMMSSTRRLA